MKLSDIKPNLDNPRKISAERLALLKESLDTFGDISGIVHNEVSDRFVGGNQRSKVMPADAEIVIVTTYEPPTKQGTIAEGYVTSPGGERFSYRKVRWDLDTEKLANLAANHHGGEDDLPKLSQWLLDLDAANMRLDLTGIPLTDIEKLLAPLRPTEGLCDEDEVPEAPPEPVVKRGELWMLGEHRLLIDDCTVKENVDRLMAGEKADMVFTDPPYGVDYDGGTTKRQKLENDHSNDIYDSVLPVIRDAMSDQAALYVWHAAGYADIASKLIESGFQIRSQIIWNKNQAQFGALSAQYKQKHEPCFYSHKKGNSPLWYGPTNEVTVWDVSRERKNEFHPTQKPVELCKRALKNNSQQKNLILDVFLGSGSTLIACEKTNRRCFGMEIDAHYGQVIIERFQKFSGKKAVREDGVAFDEINGLKKTSV